jgi:hypothetical protein
MQNKRKAQHDIQVYDISLSVPLVLELKGWNKADYDDNDTAVFVKGGGKRRISISYPGKECNFPN